MIADPTDLAWRVEVPRGSFVKRDAAGQIDLLSPLPCPFNYGSVPGQMGPDGDELDVVLLGPRRPQGTCGRSPVRGVVRFVDQGLDDDKWICSESPPSRLDRALITSFFAAYGLGKALAAALCGRPGPTGLRRVDWT